MRKLKLILLSLFLIFTLLSGALITFFYFNQDRIITAFVNELNAYLDVEARVENIELNIWDHWPYATVVLKNTTIRGANCAKDQKLFVVEKVSILANPLELLRKKYTVNRLFLENGRIYIYQGKRCNNFDIFKTESNESSALGLNKIKLTNIELIYDAPLYDQYIQANANIAELSGNISENEIIFDHDGKWKNITIRNKSVNVQRNAEIVLSHDFNYSIKSEILNIVTLKANYLDALWFGKFKLDFKGGESTLFLEASEVNVDSISTLLKASDIKLIDEYKLKGTLDFSLNAAGELNDNLKAEINFESNFLSCYARFLDQTIEFSQISGLWKISNTSDWQNSNLNFTSITGKNGNSDFSGTLYISSFRNPEIKTQFFTNQDLSLISKVLSLPIEDNASGNIDIDLSYSGFLPNAKKGIPDNATVSGILTLNQLNFKTLQPSLELKDINGQLAFEKNILNIESLSGNTSKSSFLISGRLENVIDYIFTDSKNLIINTTVKSKFIDLEEWINDGDAQNEYILKLPERIIHSHHLEIDALKFKKFNAKNIKGTLFLGNGHLDIDSVKMNVAGGKIALNLKLDASNPKRIEWFFDGTMKNLYIDSVFYVFNNFNQNFIEQRHLAGQIDADYTGFMVSDDHLQFDQSKHIFSIKSRIKNGQLILFEPLQAVSKFIREDDLMNLKFNDIENEIFIKDQIITIPQMDIHSNIRTIKVRGTHTFDNEIDYHFEIPLSREKVDKDERFGRIKDESTGKTKALIKIIGNTTNYEVKYDEEVLKQNIKEGIKEEVNELKMLLKKQKEKEESLELEEDEYFDFN